MRYTAYPLMQTDKIKVMHISSKSVKSPNRFVGFGNPLAPLFAKRIVRIAKIINLR